CVALLVRRRSRSAGLFTTRRNRPGPRSVEAALIAVTTLLLGCHARPTAPTERPQSVEDGPPPPAAPTPISTLRPVEVRTPPLLRPEGNAETTTLAGGWQVTVQPAEIQAALGDEVAFTIELRPTRSGLGRPWLRAGSRIRLESGLGD